MFTSPDSSGSISNSSMGSSPGVSVVPGAGEMIVSFGFADSQRVAAVLVESDSLNTHDPQLPILGPRMFPGRQPAYGSGYAKR